MFPSSLISCLIITLPYLCYLLWMHEVCLFQATDAFFTDMQPGQQFKTYLLLASWLWQCVCLHVVSWVATILTVTVQLVFRQKITTRVPLPCSSPLLLCLLLLLFLLPSPLLLLPFCPIQFHLYTGLLTTEPLHFSFFLYYAFQVCDIFTTLLLLLLNLSLALQSFRSNFLFTILPLFTLCPLLFINILRYVDMLLGNGRERSSHTTAVAK
jgi:hypothetical protein